MVHWVHRFERLVLSAAGTTHVANVYASEKPDGTWDGWLVFFPVAGGDPLPTDRETTQPNLQAIAYWASGLTAVYLDGALRRALSLTPDAVLARRAAHAARAEAVARAEAEAYRSAAVHARELGVIAKAEAEAEALTAEADAAATAAVYTHAAERSKQVAKVAHDEKVSAKKARAKIHKHASR